MRRSLKINCSQFGLRDFSKGFSLIELMVTVIIVGILVAIATPRYIRIVEKGRTSEARQVLGRIRSAQAAYYGEYDSYTTSFSSLGLQVPTVCNQSYYFSYGVAGGGASFTATATRCTANGKKPDHSGAAYLVNITQAGVLGGTQGYI